MKSDCCKAEVLTMHGDEGTSYWFCSKCNRACDLLKKETLKMKKKGGMKHG